MSDWHRLSVQRKAYLSLNSRLSVLTTDVLRSFTHARSVERYDRGQAAFDRDNPGARREDFLLRQLPASIVPCDTEGVAVLNMGCGGRSCIDRFGHSLSLFAGSQNWQSPHITNCDLWPRQDCPEIVLASAESTAAVMSTGSVHLYAAINSSYNEQLLSGSVADDIVRVLKDRGVFIYSNAAGHGSRLTSVIAQSLAQRGCGIIHMNMQTDSQTYPLNMYMYMYE
jgi:hypothetical protein